MKRILKKLLLLLTEIGFPFTFLSSLWLKFVRRFGLGKLSDGIFMSLGILPILDHYYEPLINPKKHLTKSLREDRNLPGVDLNLKGQLDLLDQFKYSEELLQFPLEKRKDLEYYYNNSSFESGDGEYLYNVVRHFKPKKIIEIGCGYSTLMIQNAINQNAEDNANDACNHVSIEPYEMPWLEQLPIELIRKKVEDVDLSVFETLEANDILFIDSSHMMRPQGDVLFEFLEILPELKSGVIVHVHDIFTPKDYPNKWILEDHRLWNEQYLLEAFLTCNTQFKIIGAVNYLMHNQYEALAATCPILKQQKDREPGSFWMVRT